MSSTSTLGEAGPSSSRNAQMSTTDASGTTNGRAAHHPSDASANTAADEGHETLIHKLTSGHTMEKAKHAAHKVHFSHVKSTGVSNWFHATNVHMKMHLPGHEGDLSRQESEELALMWRSRDQRKRRNTMAVPRMDTGEKMPAAMPLNFTPAIKSGKKDILNTFKKMAMSFPYWEMAFWSGWSYTIGSFLFVMDGILAWGPVAYEDWPLEKVYSGPLCFFIGALFYQVGAVVAYLEAVNDGSFHGATMRRFLDGHEDQNKEILDEKLHHFFGHMVPHHHHHKEDSEEEGWAPGTDPEAGWKAKDSQAGLQNSVSAGRVRRGGVDMGEEDHEEGHSSGYTTWRWYPSWEALRTYHVYSIGWTACTIQLFGVTLYGVTAIVVLPGILDTLAPWQKLAAFWVPQVVAAMCFLIASLMFMFETQEKWWKPEVKVLGWWIGLWSVIGSVGFELIAIFGILALEADMEWAEYQADMATIWGSGAYFAGSFLQWYEALSKNPAEEMLNEPGEMKSYQIHPL